MANPSPSLQLESLFVGIYADIKPFMDAIPKVSKGVDVLLGDFKALGDMAIAVSGTFATMATTAVQSITAMGGALALFKTNFAAFGGVLTQVIDDGAAAAALALSRVGNFVNAITAGKLGKISKSALPLQMFMEGFKNSVSGLVSTEVELASKALSKIGGFANAITKMEIDPAKVGALNSAMVGIFTSLQGAGTASTTAAGEALGRVGRGLKAISLVDPARLANVGNAIKVFMNTLASIPMPPNLPRIVAVLSQISIAAKAASASLKTVGAAIPPVAPAGRNVAAATAGVGNAASTAGSRVGWFTGRLNNMTTAAGSANMRLNTLKLTLAGFAGYGLSLFAKFDDTLTRAMAHAGIFSADEKGGVNPEFAATRGGLSKVVMDLSGESIQSVTNLTKGLDLLMASGQSAGMALKSLAIAETFATASGMEMEMATRKLVDLQRSVGNEKIIGKGSGDAVQDYYQSIAKLGDLLVGVSRQVGSTEEQMTKAFTGHFLNAMNRADMSIEKSLALLGVYSQASADFRGSGGGDAVSRAINALMNKGVQEIVPWQQITEKFGGIFDKQGKLKPIDIVSDILGKTIGGGGTMAQTAKMAMMGVAERRTQDALLPFIGKGDEIRKLEAQMSSFDGRMKMVADTIQGSFLSGMKMLWNNVSNAANAIGSRLAPAISFLVVSIESLTKAFTNLNPAWQNLIVISAAFVLLLRPMISLVTKLISSLVISPIMAFAGGIWSIASGMVSLAISIPKVLLGLASGAWSLISTLAGGLWSLFNVPLKALSGAVSIFKAAAVGVVNLFASLGVSIIAFLANLLLWLPILVSIGALASTIFIGMVQLFGAIAVGASNLWTSIKTKAGDFSTQIAEGLYDIGDAAVGMWEASKLKTRAFFEDVIVFAKNVAGFFWNFRENMGYIIDWIGEHWRLIARDMGEGTVAFLENTVKNIVILGKLIYDIGKETWGAFWDSAKYIGRGVFQFFKDEWANILNDMGTLFKTFLKNLAMNFGTIMSAGPGLLFKMSQISALDKWREDEKKLRTWTGALANDPADVDKLYLKRKAKLEKEMDETIDAISLRGPFDSMPGLKTNLGGLGTMFSRAGSALGVNLGGLKDSIPALSKTAFGSLHEPLAGFTSASLPLLMKMLNLKLPEDPKALPEFIKNMFGKGTGTGDEAGPVSSKSGPGFQFKQISLARTMLGGDVAQTLDYQQLVTLRQIVNRMDQLIAISQGRTIGPSQREPIPVVWEGPGGPVSPILGD